MALTPQQRKMLMIGVPVVGLLGIVAYMRSRSSTPAGTMTAPATVGAGTGLDAGQLASFENAVWSQMSGFQAQLDGGAQSLGGEGATGSSSVAALPGPTPPAPSPIPPPSTATPGIAYVTSTPTYLGAVSPSGTFVDAGTPPSATGSAWSTTQPTGLAPGEQTWTHTGAGGQTYYTTTPALQSPNTLPPGAVLPSWAGGSVETYFATG